MEFKKILSITGLGGLWFAVTQRNDGLIAKSLDLGKTQFVPSRLHQFTFLESITIYLSNNESKELKKVFLNIKEKQIALPDSNKSSSDELRNFFLKCEPEHDTELVHISDIKKIIKWYQILDKNDLLKEENEESTEVENKEAKEEAPKAKKTTKTKVEKEEKVEAETEAEPKKAPKKATKKAETTKEASAEKPATKKASKKSE